VKIFGAGTPISLGKSLGLKGIDFNLVVSIIYFAVTIGLLSSNILMKKYLAKIFFPIIVVIWGAIVLSVVDTAGVVIFCNTSETFERLVGAFNPHGFSISAMYGDLTSVEQATITKDFRSGTPHTLLATNMLARGISVPLSASVVNFGLPAVYKDCIYRTSFSAPFDRNGVTVNLLTTADVCKAHNIEQYYNTKMGETTIHFQARHQSPKSYTPSPYKGLPSDFH
jgi:superfamily II DNA/RNA helicase